jgi:translation initiation factor 2B subunit (eIF-2B alpha/beta/delta family)
MRQTIAALLAATETAERAAASLRASTLEAESKLAGRLDRAEERIDELDQTIAAGEDLARRIARVVRAGASLPAPEQAEPEPVPATPAIAPEPSAEEAERLAALAAAAEEAERLAATAAAAEALAERARRRIAELAEKAA